MKVTEFVLVFVLLAFGCIGGGSKDCGADKECLINAFKNCEKAHGTWEGSNGDINVEILGKKGDGCSVFVSVRESGLDISRKNMTCELPMAQNDTEFAILSDCVGPLKDFFS